MALKESDFITAIETKSGRFRIDKVKIVTPSGLFKGSGNLECGDKVKLSVTLPKGKSIPERPAGIVARKDFWTVGCVVDESLRIKLEGVPPSGESHYGDGRTTIILNISELDIEPEEWDKKTHAQILKLLEGHRQANGGGKAIELVAKKPTERRKHREVEFFAILKDFELIARNKGTEIIETNDFLGKRSKSRSDTFMGSLSAWNYGLIQVGDNLHVHLKSKESYVSKGKANDQKHLDAFLRAIAFTHGQHAWPWRLTYRVGHKLLTNKVRIVRKTSRTSHAPFSQRIWFNSRVGNIAWDFGDALQTTYTFFVNETLLSKEIEELLYLFREAGGCEIPLQIELLTICSLYESLMRAIFAHQSLGVTKSPEVLAFIAEKKKIVQELKQNRKSLPKLEAAAYSRMMSLLASASPESIREIVEIVSSRLLINSSVNWKKTHKEWSTFRNPLSHKISAGADGENNLPKYMMAVSRISGAINVVLLKLMGYSGMARTSVYEEEHKTI